MTLRDRLVERIAPLLEQARATLLRDGKPLAEPVPVPAGAVSTDPVLLPLAGVEAADLAARVEQTIRRYVAGLIGERDVAMAVLEHPILVARWPLSAGMTLPRTNEDYRRAYSDDERAASALATIESSESARVDWPIDVAPVEVVSALRRVPPVPPGEEFDGRFDLDAARVAWLVENGRVGWISSEGGFFVGDGKGASGAFVGDGGESQFVGVFAGEPAEEPALCFERWTPLAVAVVLHVEREALEWSSLYAVRHSLERVRSLYGDKLTEHVSDALEREQVEDRAQALPELASATREALRRFGEIVNADDPARWPSTEAEALAERDGVLELDAAFAAFVEQLGAKGTEYARIVRETGRVRLAEYKAGRMPRPGQMIRPASWLWEPWTTDRAVGLAVALWPAVLERLEAARKNPAGLTRAVTADVLDLYSRRYEPEDRGGQQALVFPEQRGWVLVPSLYDGTLASILERGVGLLTSETGIDLLEWEVTEAHRQYIEQPSDFRHITIEGGWSALAHERLGYTSKKAPEQVRAIVLAQAHLRFESYGVRGNLLTYAEPRKHAPGQRALVTLTLGDMLLAGFTHALREEHGASSLASREGRRLVPILGKAALVGRNNESAAQRRMVWRLAMTLRDSAEELAREGSVRIPLDRWATLADEAGAPHTGAFLSRVLGAWEQGDDRTPPLIERKGERVTLHESRKAALDFIVSGGQLSLRKRRDGKAGARGRALGRRGRKG